MYPGWAWRVRSVHSRRWASRWAGSMRAQASSRTRRLVRASASQANWPAQLDRPAVPVGGDGGLDGFEAVLDDRARPGRPVGGGRGR